MMPCRTGHQSLHRPGGDTLGGLLLIRPARSALTGRLLASYHSVLCSSPPALLADSRRQEFVYDAAKCAGLIRDYRLIPSCLTSLTFGPGDGVYSASLNLREGGSARKKAIKGSQLPVDLFEAGKTCPGVDRGPFPREPYLCREVNSQLIKIRALEKCCELGLLGRPADQSRGKCWGQRRFGERGW